jgi:hypothetical protein
MPATRAAPPVDRAWVAARDGIVRAWFIQHSGPSAICLAGR